MGTGYNRQSIFTAGDVVDDEELNLELDTIESAFDEETGHSHDGTTANGPVINIIGDYGLVSPKNKVVVDTDNDKIDVYVDVGGSSVKQLSFKDGVVEPTTTNDVDLGSTSKVYKDIYTKTILAGKVKEVATDLSISAGNVNVDWSAGTYFNYTNNAAHTLTFQNVPTNSGGYGQSILIAITNPGAYSLSIVATGFNLKRPANTDSLLTASGLDVLLCTAYGKNNIVIVPLKNMTAW